MKNINSPKEFQDELVKYWEKVQDVYEPFRYEFKKNYPDEFVYYYVFQTETKFQPDLMIVGINPGLNAGYDGQHFKQSEVNDKNIYTEGNHPWLNKMRKVFGTDFLRDKLENCVGTNICFAQSGNAGSHVYEYFKDKWRKNSKLKELIDEMLEIIQPKKIITLGRDPYNCLGGVFNWKYPELKRELLEKKYGDGEITFKYTKSPIPTAYIPNFSGINNKYYSSEKIKLWQEALTDFFNNNKKKRG